jgi:hypothetical protein
VRAIFPDKDEVWLKEDFFRSTQRGFFVEVGAFEPIQGLPARCKTRSVD